MPDSWARYSRASRDALIKPGQKSALLGELALQQLWGPLKEAAAIAEAEYQALVDQLMNALPGCELVADDASLRQVVLQRRHWAGAIFEFENNALRRGDQRWTNVEVRARSQMRRGDPAPTEKSRPASARMGGPKPIDDERHVARFLKESAHAAGTSIRDFVLRHAKEIDGASLDAKIRRLQRRLEGRI